MKEAIKVDLDGLFVEPVIVPLSQTGVSEICEFHPAADTEERFEELPTGYLIAEKVPDGFFLPRWDFAQSVWVEGRTQAEIDLLWNASQQLDTSQGNIRKAWNRIWK